MRTPPRFLLPLAVLLFTAACATAPRTPSETPPITVVAPVIVPDSQAGLSAQAARPAGTPSTPDQAAAADESAAATPSPDQAAADTVGQTLAATGSGQAAAADQVGTPDAAAGSGVAAQNTDPAAAPATPVARSPADYANLFDRIRAGFTLPDSDHRAIDRELDWYAGNPDYLDRAFSRADLYLYHIVTQLEQRHMPLELALLPVVESAFEPFAYSHSAASGLWQFIRGTGSRFGLKQDWWYDGRRDVVESTRAALDYLQSLHDEFNGDWLLAIAAYNCGELNVERAVRYNTARGRPVDFWNLPLPAETRAYVPKLLAMKRVVATPEKFGLAFNIPNQPYFVQVDTRGQIDLRVAAQIAGVSNEDLYELNPAFHRWATDPSGDTSGRFNLLVPADAAEAFRSNVAQLTDDQRRGVTAYAVRHGDSMTRVARRFHTTTQALRELNDLPKGPLVVGAELRVPADTITLPAKVLHAAALADSPGRRARRGHRGRIVVHRGDTLYAIARKHGVDVNALAMVNGLQPGDVLRTGQHLRLAPAGTRAVDPDDATPAGSASADASGTRQLTHVVRPGDTLFHIARRYHVSVAQLVSWNRLEETALRAGQKLIIRAGR